MVRIGMLLSDRYEILEKIGSGGMSDVYKAKCHKLNRLVAIKVLKQEYSTDKNFVGKFWAEAQSAACLTHPNIVNVYDVGNDQGVYYIVMELVEGITLKKYIEKKGKLEIRESIGIAMQVCQGMEAAHEQRIIHRDIKPQNIIISRDGKVKVTDFGIARAASSQTISSNAMGSVHYISPEQARGGYCDERSDIYSMGIVMYEMLTGTVPFEGESTVQVALMHIQSEMAPPRKYEPMIPVSLEKIILKCTQKKPEARYSGVAALTADLRRALMTPDEDFVKITPIISSNDPTRVMSSQEVEQIKSEVRSASSAPSAPLVDEDEEAYLMGYEDEEEEYGDEGEERMEDLEEYEDEDEETDPKFEKIITYISIGVAVVIVILAVWILGRAFGLFKGGNQGNNQTTAAQESTENESGTVVMPSLLGKTLDEAEAELTALGLRIYIDYQEPQHGEPDGEVIGQEFEPGERVNKGYQVKVTVCLSNTAENVAVPKGLVGSSYEDARKALLGASLIPVPEEMYDDEVKEGVVMSVDPVEGTELEAGTKVKVVVSLGPEIVTVPVPGVEGDKEEEARNTLETLGLKVTVKYQFDEEVEEGRVISQSVKAGEMVEVDSSITIVVSEGSNQTTVPNLLGKTLEEANQALEERGLKLSGSYNEENSDSVEAGRVMGQSIGADTTVELGTTVTVTLSKGRAQATVPDLLNQTLEEARRSLEAVGLKLDENYNEESSESIAADRVMWQSVQAGTQLKQGEQVTITLSTGSAYVEVPNILNRTLEDAKAMLASEGLYYSVTKEDYNAAEKGTVILCDPGVGVKVSKGATVKLTVSLGPAPTTEAPTTAAPPAADPPAAPDPGAAGGTP